MSISVELSGSSWISYYNSPLYEIVITNNESYKVKITSITVPLSYGQGSVYGQVSGQTSRFLFNCTRSGYAGKNCAAGVFDKSSGGSRYGYAEPTTSVSVQGTGSTSSGGYFYSATSLLTIPLTTTIDLGPGSSTTLYVRGKDNETVGAAWTGTVGDSNLRATCICGNRSNDLSSLCSYEYSIYTCTCSITTQPSSLIYYGNSVTVSATCGSGETLSYQWYNSDGTTISGATSATRTPSKSGEYCIITSSKSGYQSVSITSNSVKVKLNTPSLSHDNTVPMYNGSLNAYWSGKHITPSDNTNPGQLGRYWECKVGNGSWTHWSENDFNFTSPVVKVRYSLYKSGYENSEFSNELTLPTTKLNKPTNLSISGATKEDSYYRVTVENSVTASCVVDSVATASYQWYKDPDILISGATSSCYRTNQDDNEIYYIVQAVDTNNKYTPSETAVFSETIYVYDEPRRMSEVQWSPTFILNSVHTSPQIVVTPNTLVNCKFKEFNPNNNLGRFNYYKLELLVNNEVQSTKEGQCGPYNIIGDFFKTDNISVSSFGGKICQLKLSCGYKDNSIEYHDDKDSCCVFYSDEFLVGGQPVTPTLIYPSLTSFNPCNTNPYIIMEMYNPDYLEGVSDITKISVKVTESPGTSSEKVLPEYIKLTSEGSDSIFCLVRTFTNDTPPDGCSKSALRVIFRPDHPILKSGTKIEVTCTNDYGLTCQTPLVINAKLDTLSYVNVGDTLSASQQRDKLYHSVENHITYYKNVLDCKQDFDARVIFEQLVQSDPFDIMIEILNSICKEFENKYGPDLNIRHTDFIEMTQDKTVESKDSESPNVFNNPSFGNYFNDILYVLKKLL